MARKLIIGNWKLNGNRASNRALLGDLVEHWIARPGVALVVCPPAPYLEQTAQILSDTPIAWGAQDVSEQEGGPFTGEVSCRMLLEFGCRYAVVGHSERRSRFAESDALVAAKARSALQAGLMPVVCIGETAAEHARGDALEVLRRQVSAVLAAVPARELPGLAFAYEPLWAIGTGQNAAPAVVQQVHAFLRGLLAQADLAAAA